MVRKSSYDEDTCLYCSHQVGTNSGECWNCAVHELESICTELAGVRDVFIPLLKMAESWQIDWEELANNSLYVPEFDDETNAARKVLDNLSPRAKEWPSE